MDRRFSLKSFSRTASFSFHVKFLKWILSFNGKKAIFAKWLKCAGKITRALLWKFCSILSNNNVKCNYLPQNQSNFLRSQKRDPITGSFRELHFKMVFLWEYFSSVSWYFSSHSKCICLIFWKFSGLSNDEIGFWSHWSVLHISDGIFLIYCFGN